MSFDLTTIGISLLSLTISLISLWQSYLSPFKLRIDHSTPRFILYKITPKISGDKLERTWWIPSFDLGVSFCNLGQRTGQVLDFRITADLVTNDGTRHYEFYPKFIVDYKSFNENHTDRFIWIEKAVIRKWYALTLAGKETISLHLVMEHLRWDNIEEGMMTFCLEAFSSQTKRWLECERYSLEISKDMYEGKSSYETSDVKLEEIRRSPVLRSQGRKKIYELLTRLSPIHKKSARYAEHKTISES